LLTLSKAIIAALTTVAPIAICHSRACSLFNCGTCRHAAAKLDLRFALWHRRRLQSCHLVLIGGRRRRGRGLLLLRLLGRRSILCDCRRLLQLWRHCRNGGARPPRTGAVENFSQLLGIDLWLARTGSAVFVGNDVGVRPLSGLLRVGRQL